MSNGKKLKYSIRTTDRIPVDYARARRAYPKLLYTKNGKSSKVIPVDQARHTASQMRRFLKKFTFTGTADGEADRIEVTLINCDWRWMRSWMPKKKDKISASIIMKHWKSGETTRIFRCGTFLIDNLGMSGPELACTVGATSIPETSSFRATERKKAWKKATLKEIAKKIAARYRMKLVFDGEDFSVGTVEQNDQTDCSFLTELCQEYNYGIKMYKGKLVIYSKKKYEEKGVVGTISRRMLLDFAFETNISGTYTGAKMKYTKADSDEETVVKVGKGNRWFIVSGDADSIAQARRKALAAVNRENEATTTLDITIRGNTRYNETDTVRIRGLYRLSGKYFIDQVIHDIDADSGFTTKLTMHKVQKRVTK